MSKSEEQTSNGAPGRPSSRTTSRRQFTRVVAAAFVAAAPIAASMAQTPATTKEPKAPPNPQPAPAGATTTPRQQPPKPSPAALAYAEVARARFGDKLTPEELERVTRDLEGNVRAAERLRTLKLKNADEPDFVFSA